MNPHLEYLIREDKWMNQPFEDDPHFTKRYRDHLTMFCKYARIEHYEGLTESQRDYEDNANNYFFDEFDYDLDKYQPWEVEIMELLGIEGECSYRRACMLLGHINTCIERSKSNISSEMIEF